MSKLRKSSGPKELLPATVPEMRDSWSDTAGGKHCNIEIEHYILLKKQQSFNKRENNNDLLVEDAKKLPDSNSQFANLPKIPNGFTINTPRRVAVQHNLCVHIPCSFQVPPIYTLSKSAQGIWLKGDHEKMNIVARKAGPDDPQNEHPHFFLTGEVWKGDCSLRISDAKYEDDNIYTFRLEDNGVHFSFVEIKPKVTVIDLTDTPEISPMQTLVAGERVTLTCTSPGRCSGKAPKITWEGTFNKRTLRQYTIYNGDNTRSYHSNLTFIPTVNDSLKKLQCKVTFADSLTSTSETIELDVEGRDSEEKTSLDCSSMDYRLLAGIIGGNIIILLLIGLGVFCFIKRHMKKALQGQYDLETDLKTPDHKEVNLLIRHHEIHSVSAQCQDEVA
ncbi:PREDICTED: sialic acid-binding Ig-like lectin 12 [Nanorana parkeri]|uniref:sialic acid-binding Ig-like lectin 12 n=1 Tax=Nanorana parkeri TaxID=125878 RepID=UPI0008546489|nr:PREDICTED: sialic acid-binding Ig-like lectin 12 [Nanorana parkeri]